jgi:hypothetical protein
LGAGWIDEGWSAMNAPRAKAIDTSASPFRPGEDDAFRRWRERKLAGQPTAGELWVEIGDPLAPSAAERDQIARLCARSNMAFYAWRKTPPEPRQALRAFAAALGLSRLDANPFAGGDGITALESRAEVAARGYVPYGGGALAWHTDGYYNAPDRPVRAVILHCLRPAAEGGANDLFDHELAYLRLRDIDPAHVAALMQPGAMTIPAKAEAGAAPRPARSGPVFAAEGAHLHMRYTSRRRSIAWKDDARLDAARAALAALLAAPSPDHVHVRLDAGQGILGNNVLHCRAAFSDGDGPGRLVLRARYHDRVGLPAREEERQWRP